MAGRPSKYTKEVADAICSSIIAGLSLRAICDGHDEMPDKVTVCRWLTTNEAFRKQYTQARELQAELMADEIMDIADDGTNDFVERKIKGGAVVLCDHENINRSRLRVDARKWVAAKLLPKKYGDKLEVGGEGGGPVKVMLIGSK